VTVKANYAPAGSALALRWNPGGFAAQESGGARVRPKSRKEAEAEADGVFLELLAKFVRRGQRVGASPGPNYAPRIFEREGAEFGAKVLAAAMSRLLDIGVIEIAEDGPPSKRRCFLRFV
jgi:hypothetical protein